MGRSYDGEDGGVSARVGGRSGREKNWGDVRPKRVAETCGFVRGGWCLWSGSYAVRRPRG